MNFSSLPETIEELTDRSWSFFAPYYADLQARPLTAGNARAWLADWSQLTRVFVELYSVLSIEKTLDTADEARESAYNDFITNIYPEAVVAEQGLKERLLALDLADPDLAVLLRNMRNEAELFREENVPLDTELHLLGNRYDKLTGGLQVTWRGEKKNLSQLLALLESKDRQVREEAWKLAMAQWQSIRRPLNDLFLEMLALRRQIAHNAGFADFRDFTFRQLGRFDYTPADCLTFHEAIEQTVVPAARRILEKTRQQLGLERLRPWDWMPENGILAETNQGPPLTPYRTEAELVQGGLNIFHQVDAELGRFFADMAENSLLDLESRQGKALGGYCTTLPLRGKPFIFMNGNGTHDTVQTLLHEAGHAFHAYEARHPLIWQEDVPIEFCEVASMAMELLAAPYMTRDSGGYYDEAEAARARLEHLHKVLLFLPYMAAVDAFQHQVYTSDAALTAADLDAIWLDLEKRFLAGVDWSGLEEERTSGWHRKLHIFHIPFYYVEYGIASIGALQIWRNCLEQGQPTALSAYRRGLALGGTRPLPELFAAAGAAFRFDAPLLTELVALVEEVINDLTGQLEPVTG